MRKKTNFDESLQSNMLTYNAYVKRITELALSRFKWNNLPSTCDRRYLELGLFEKGQMLFFNDDVMGYLTLNFNANGQFDVYNYPISRIAYANNGYYNTLSNKDSVIVYNNFLRTNDIDIVLEYAKKLYNLDRIIDVNANAQKTPVLVQSSDAQRLTLKNLYKEFDGNAPVIYGNKDLDINSLKVLKTDAPYVADKIYELKTNLWNECLTYLGITNVSINKRERLVSDEVNRSLGGVIANRKSRLKARQQACDKINDMFDLDISVEFDDVEDTNTSLDENKELLDNE